jgi:hypothetical protein
MLAEAEIVRMAMLKELLQESKRVDGYFYGDATDDSEAKLKR